MKKVTEKMAAVLAAAIMAASSGISAYAEPGIVWDAEGWSHDYYGWSYYDENDHFKVRGRDHKAMDGIMYSFDDKGYCTGKKTGWSEEDGLQRRYKDGLPYIGWIKNKEDGTRSYCFDGYKVTGDFQIGNMIYIFDSDGIYTGKGKRPAMTAECQGTVCCDSDVILLTVTGTDMEKCFGEPYIMERWENGKWAEVEHISVHAVYSTLKRSGGSKSFTFSPQKNNLSEGYYRIAFTCWDEDNFEETKENFYAVFEVLPPVEIKVSEEIYLFVPENAYSDNMKVEAEVIVNSEKLKGQELAVSVYNRFDEGYPEWYQAKDITVRPDEEDGRYRISYEYDFRNRNYDWRKFSIEVDGREYFKVFRVEKLRDISVSSGSKGGKVFVTVKLQNTYYKPITIDAGSFYLTEKAGKKADRISDPEPNYVTLEPGEKITLKYNLSEAYGIRLMLEKGRYEIFVPGAGRVSWGVY